MYATIWLLPDFIGHPLCFSAFAAKLTDRASLRHVNYHAYWPYLSIADLASAVADDWDGPAPQWLVGYSFGGLVGFELAALLGKRTLAPSPRLLLIDSRLGNEGGATTLTRLVGSDAYVQLSKKIDALAALGEVERACVDANLAIFSGYRPPLPVHATDDVTLIIGRLSGEDYKSAELWNSYLPDMRRHRIDVAHQEMLTDPAALNMILSILAAKEET